MVSHCLDCTTNRNVLSVSSSSGDLATRMMSGVTLVVAWVSAVAVVVAMMVMVLRSRDSRNIRVVRWIIAAIRDVDGRRGRTSC